MNERKARKILEQNIKEDEGLFNDIGFYLNWDPMRSECSLDGVFSADVLEAIAWWMRNMKVTHEKD